MVIEWLKFHVPPTLQIHFLEQDLAHWTQALSTQPGFVSKEVWLNPVQTDEIMLVIRWRTRQQWKAICPNFLAQIEANFCQAVGADNYCMVEVGEYEIHKLPHLHVMAPKAESETPLGTAG
jgi:uncharacterized protein (TIGR03792 family)